jgi:hypothetical protein
LRMAMAWRPREDTHSQRKYALQGGLPIVIRSKCSIGTRALIFATFNRKGTIAKRRTKLRGERLLLRANWRRRYVLCVCVCVCV